MPSRNCGISSLGITLGAAAILLAWNRPGGGADHGDVPQLGQMGRSDAMLTDLHVFRRGDNLVLSLCTNPNIPTSVGQYIFPSDLTLSFFIDNRSKVRFDNPPDRARYGGTIVDPGSVAATMLFEVTFDKRGAPKLKTHGLPGKFKKEIPLFAGLCDDPFIRRPRIGRNVAAVVLEIPLDAVIDREPTLLVWATSQVPDIRGPILDHAGRALRSMFRDEMNVLTPAEQFFLLGEVPDVVIFKTNCDAVFPNGRELVDDVVDLADYPRPLLPTEGPTFPTANDVDFRDKFPYLADRHPPH
jgi:hypothetical protein